MTRRIYVGKVPVGGGAAVSVQSMTNTKTGDEAATVSQIRALALAGCDIVRVTVNDEEAARAIGAIVRQSPVPLVADIHFNYRYAIRAAEAGVAALRINPGNIGPEENVKKVADCVKGLGIPVRVGVNAGSLEGEILKKYGAPTAQALFESAMWHARLFEKHGVGDIALSMKSSSVKTTVDACRIAAKGCDYPLHIGVTEAGGGELAVIKGAAGIGCLLLEGIGDTLRVSLTGDPVREAQAGVEILRALGLRRDFVEVISCPTCGRTVIDVQGIAARVREATKNVRKPLRVAVMGCVVNGPGEAREADVGIAGGGDGSGAILVKGQPPRRVEGDLYAHLMHEIQKLL